MLQKFQVFTLSLKKSIKKLDGWELAWRVAQRAGQEVCFWRKKCCFCDLKCCSCDNFPAHPHIDNLKAIQLYFLQPNTTSKTQPIDRCVIRSLKYSKNVVWKIIQSVEKKKTLPKMSLLQGMQMLVSAWDALLTQTIVNCFQNLEYPTKTRKLSKQKMTILSRNYKTKLTTFLLFNPILSKTTLMPLLLSMLMLKL